MTRRREIAFIALVMTCSFTVLAQDRQTPSQDWEVFTGPDAQFSVLMPGRPRHATGAVEGKAGSSPTYAFAFETPDIEYVVGYVDFPAILDDPKASKEFLDKLRDRMVAKESGKLVDEIDISTGNHPGREMVIQVSVGSFRDRVYLVERRFYFLTVFIPSSKSSTRQQGDMERSARKFLDSFKLRPASVSEKPN